MDLPAEVPAAARLVALATRTGHAEAMREGLILTPAHGQVGTTEVQDGSARVAGVALDASGAALRDGMEALRGFVRSCVAGAA
jgi:hypothetical protein